MPQTIAQKDIQADIQENTPENTPETRISPSPHPGATASAREWQALLGSAGFAPLPATGWFSVTGADRVRWLNGMVTNSIGDLAPGRGCYNFVLSAQGRIQGDGYVFAEPDHLRFETSLAHREALLALLDRFIIMDDVELTTPPEPAAGLLLAGPGARDLLSALGIAPPADPAPSLLHARRDGQDLTVIHAHSPLVPRFELWSDATAIAKLSADLLAHNAVPCTPAAIDLLRIAEGTPLFGIDIRDRDLPQETGAARALHFAKGCYLGQEIVERIRSRGNVHRTFSGFHLTGPATPGTALTTDGKPVGELTGVASLPAHDGQPDTRIALGYIRREALALGKPIQYEGGIAQPVPLPFARAKLV